MEGEEREVEPWVGVGEGGEGRRGEEDRGGLPPGLVWVEHGREGEEQREDEGERYERHCNLVALNFDLRWTSLGTLFRIYKL